MNTLYFEEEINLDEEDKKEEFTPAELEMATKLVNAMSGDFRPEDYIDEYQTRIKNAINQKIKGEEIKKPKAKKSETITDLMSALEKSIKRVK